MFVKERMTTNVVTVEPHASVPQAVKLMRDRHIRRLPVVDDHGQLVGIVSDKDLLLASPSPATSLSVWEITYLLSELKVSSVMTRKVITVTEDAPLENAARIMADEKIGGLPVLADGKLAGIITETDLFGVFVELLGAREPGVRATTLVRNQPGQLAIMTRAIADSGGNIIAIADYTGDDPDTRLVLVKADGITQDGLVAALEPAVLRIVDVRVV